MAELTGANDWCTIESDPGVFTELLEDLGVQDVELQEVYSLDELSTSQNEVYGLIFLFQWVADVQEQHAASKEPLEESAIPPGLFFAHQVTTNACATQAVLSVLLNATHIRDKWGNILQEFHSFTAAFPPNLRGVAVASSEEIKTAHNKFARPEALWEDPGSRTAPPGQGEAFHFVAYVPSADKTTVYELDGLQKGPIVVGQVADGTDWLTVASQALQERMQAAHIKFNLMAVTADPRVAWRQQLSDDTTDDATKATIQTQLAHHDAMREQWHKENQRRRHNYLPLCLQMLKELAKAGALPELAQQASERVAAKMAAKKQQA
jgi:ubiquitin carboxyl-terminal hydrolase L5